MMTSPRRFRMPGLSTRPRCRAPLPAVIAVLMAALGAGSPAAAHQYWLAPSRYLGAAGKTVEIGAIAGTGFRGERKPFNPSRCVRLVVRSRRLLDLAPLGRQGEFVWGSFAPSDSGGALFAFESDYAPITLPVAEFDAYLKLEGLDGPLAVRHQQARRDSVRERYRRCPKSWIAGSDAARATAPIGLPLEVVPLTVPGAAPDLGVRVLWEGKPLAGALLRAWRAPIKADGSPSDGESRDSVGVAWELRTDAKGEAVARVAAAGEWLLSVVHMAPSPDPKAADWQSTWASLTFVRPREPRR